MIGTESKYFIYTPIEKFDFSTFNQFLRKRGLEISLIRPFH